MIQKWLFSEGNSSNANAVNTSYVKEISKLSLSLFVIANFLQKILKSRNKHCCTTCLIFLSGPGIVSNDFVNNFQVQGLVYLDKLSQKFITFINFPDRNWWIFKIEALWDLLV